jgi:cyclic-di-AMP phosphodiesterase PgpH
MSLFGIRRGRSHRGTALRLATGSSADIRTILTDRTILARLAVALVTTAMILAAVQGWKPSFPYRLEQRPDAGVTATIGFERINRERTNRARDRAAEQVLQIFSRDNRALNRLASDLRAGLLTFAQADDVSMLPADIRRAFGLSAEGALPPGGGLPGGDRAVVFQRLKQVAADAEQLRDLITDFVKFLQPIDQYGLLRPEHLPGDLPAGGQIAVRDADGNLSPVALAEVQLIPLLAPNGRLHARWAVFPNLLPFRPELEYWLKVQSPETLFFDNAATQAARQQARLDEPEVTDVYNKGDLLVKPGESIDESRLELLQAEFDQLAAKVSLSERVVRSAFVFLMLAILSALIGYHLWRHEPKLVWNIGALSLYLGMIVVAVALARVLSFDPWRAELAPVLVAVMVCAIAHNQVLATVTAFALSLIVTVSTGADIGRFIVLMSVSSTAAILLHSVPSRSTLVVVGTWSAVVCFLMSWGVSVVESRSGFVDDPAGGVLWRDSVQWFLSLRGAGWCLAAGFLVSGSLPFIESAFGAVTDISLLELGDVSHPILQELVRRAPGTYNHSITVASIGETAADAIGANGLLVRVGAYFHDIGKMLKAHYFVENMTGGENRHENLAPAMSTLIIIGHVKDGADLARQHNLPEPLVDFIEQHHGTTLVEYFYHEATRQAEEQPDHRTDAEESHFRYPGPKPRTREAAVLMIADAVEGASRTLSEPTSSRIERLVHDIALKRLLDGQFDESGLTMTELGKIEESLTKSLTAMYHGRVKYPEQRTA